MIRDPAGSAPADTSGAGAKDVPLVEPTASQLAEELEYQKALLQQSRDQTGTRLACCGGLEFVTFPRVFAPNLDTQVLVESLPLLRFASFLEIGCGSGAVAVFAARSGATGVAVDLNRDAVANTRANLERHAVQARVRVHEGDIFGPVEGRFDLVIANLPFMRTAATDLVDRAIFDERLDTWRRFFSGVGAHLGHGGGILTVLPNFCSFREILGLAATQDFRWEYLRSVREDWREFASFRLHGSKRG